MVSIAGTPPQRSSTDYSLCVCATLALLLLVLLIDAYEYISVPGANRARNKLRGGVDLAGNTLHNGVESLTGLDLMTKAEKKQMQRDIEEAREVIRKKHEEVEAIVEKVDRMEKEMHTAAALPVDNLPLAVTKTVVVQTAQEKAKEEEKKEEIVEEIVEKELGLEKWCGSCSWKSMGFTCDARVKWMIEKYHITEVTAKDANIKECSNK